MLNSLEVFHAHRDIHDTWVDAIEDRLAARNLRHYASQLLGKGLSDETELERALQRAVIVLTAADLPPGKHVKTIFICDRDSITKDWLVSQMCLSLILLNADASNPVVARMQVKILSGQFIKPAHIA